MNRFRTALLFALALAAAVPGCSRSSQNGPEIAALVYAPNKQPVEQGRTATVTGKFTVVKRSAETASVNSIVFDSKGKQIGSAAIPLTDRTLRNADELAFAAYIDTSKKEDYTFHVYAVDSKGRQSNRLTGTFSVTDLF